MAEIKGYQTQYKTQDSGAWGVIARYDNPCMETALDDMSRLMRLLGAGFYRIVRVNSDAGYTVQFYAAFSDSAATFADR